MRVAKWLKVCSATAAILALIGAQVLFVYVGVSADDPSADDPSTTLSPTVLNTDAAPTATPAAEDMPPTSTPVPADVQPEDTAVPSDAVTPAQDPASAPVDQAAATSTAIAEPTTTLEPTPTATLESSPSPTPAPTPTAGPLPTSTPEPPEPATAHLAVLVTESVVPVGAKGRSEVLVFLQDVDPGIQALELVLSYNPTIVHIADADGQAGNGVQVALAPFFGDSQVVTTNQADNATGKLVLALVAGKGPAIQQTDTWKKVATITWVGRQEGNSVVAIQSATSFTSEDGRRVAPDAAHNGTLFVRQPGKITGTVKIQGRQASSGVVVSSLLSKANVDQAQTDRTGRFAIVTSHGEGFYTLLATMPGYLSATGDRPVKVTVGTVVDLGNVVLLGGDVNGDDRVDIRDLSYIAWHFDQADTQADFNRDGRVDILDLTLTAGNFGKSGPTIWPIPN
jgi:hypothetical protein